MLAHAEPRAGAGDPGDTNTASLTASAGRAEWARGDGRRRRELEEEGAAGAYSFPASNSSLAAEAAARVLLQAAEERSDWSESVPFPAALGSRVFD